jgi:hypothetical protein|uniref:Uncharacterized protein n=1 Tax=Picea glauca TaxID=3330 RepID=A0A117NI20_PICGL|nr:hypothetical protein ABT39_MTgene3754 [Picea glauca]QHR88279.1 hypothetical protein Q903MT_gene2292 [Picea sitchensis]
MELDPRLELALPLYLQRGMQLRLGKLALDLYLHPLLLPHTRPSEDNISIDLILSPKGEEGEDVSMLYHIVIGFSSQISSYFLRNGHI